MVIYFLEKYYTNCICVILKLCGMMEQLINSIVSVTLMYPPFNCLQASKFHLFSHGATFLGSYGHLGGDCSPWSGPFGGAHYPPWIGLTLCSCQWYQGDNKLVSFDPDRRTSVRKQYDGCKCRVNVHTMHATHIIYIIYLFYWQLWVYKIQLPLIQLALYPSLYRRPKLSFRLYWCSLLRHNCWILPVVFVPYHYI